jgi:tetratricopeptide (TPR) repeat protein
MKYFWLLLLFNLVATATVSAQAADANCSETANKLLRQAWIAQPMNVPENNGDPGKAEGLYKQAINDSPKCRRAAGLLVALLIRGKKYSEAYDYNEKLLRQFPDDPGGLSEKADLVSRINKDYPLALEIETKLLKVPDFNKNGNVFYKIARIYSLMNQSDNSLNYLKRALDIDKGWGNKANAQGDSGFENLRKDPRFRALVKK